MVSEGDFSAADVTHFCKALKTFNDAKGVLAASACWIEIRKLGFKTFTPGPFFAKRTQRNVPPPLCNR